MNMKVQFIVRNEVALQLYEKGYSYRWIAQKMNRSKVTIRSYISRAKRDRVGRLILENQAEKIV